MARREVIEAVVSEVTETSQTPAYLADAVADADAKLAAEVVAEIHRYH